MNNENFISKFPFESIEDLRERVKIEYEGIKMPRWDGNLPRWVIYLITILISVGIGVGFVLLLIFRIIQDQGAL